MSYNCHAEYLGAGRLRIKQKDYVRLFKRYDEYQGLAESNFITDSCVEPSENPAELTITELMWSGSGSVSCFDTLKKKVLTKTLGTADILFTWEGGDSFSGLRVVDGKVIECDVVQALQPCKDAS